MQSVIGASKIFTGAGWLEDHVIVVENAEVAALLPRTAYSGAVDFYPGHYLVPPFIDLQVYGARKKLLAVYPEADTLFSMQEEFHTQGTRYFLPTVATNTMEVFMKSIEAVKAYWKLGGKGVLGLHLEGPWLNPLKAGAHVKEWMHSPSETEVNHLLSKGKDVIKMITLAPELCSKEIIQTISSKGILVSAGHSNADYDEAMQSFDGGVKAVTHLYNAMSALQHRAPGLVGASFNHHSVRASIIPDGYHVDFEAVKIAKTIMGERLFAITDAVTETAEGPYQHQLAGDKYECNGVLSGSALSMHQAFKNLVEKSGIEMGEALRMCSLYPAQLMGMEKKTGRIAPGSEGAFLLLDGEMGVVDLFIR